MRLVSGQIMNRETKQHGPEMMFIQTDDGKVYPVTASLAGPHVPRDVITLFVPAPYRLPTAPQQVGRHRDAEWRFHTMPSSGNPIASLHHNGVIYGSVWLTLQKSEPIWYCGRNAQYYPTFEKAREEIELEFEASFHGKV